MIQAWRMADGRYRVVAPLRDGPGWEDALLDDGAMLHAARPSPGPGEDTVAEDELERLGAEKVLGVITGPSSCGCEPMTSRWVTEREVEAGWTHTRLCMPCTNRALRGPAPSDPDRVPELPVRYRHDIIEIMGEADVAQAVYEAEFAWHFR